MSTAGPSSSSSSSSTITTTSSTPTPPQSWPAPPNGTTNSGSDGVNYFFGFLVAFIVLLLFFIGCGFGARRSLLRSRRWQHSFNNAELGLGDDLDFLNFNEPKEPVFWESPFEKGTGQWESMMPLSASILQDGTEVRLPPLNTPLLPPPSWLSAQPRRHRRRSFESIVLEPFTIVFAAVLPRLRRQRVTPAATETATINDNGLTTRMTSRPSIPASLIPSTQPLSPPIPPSGVPPDGGTTALPPEKTSASSDQSTELLPMKIVDVQVAVMIAMPSQVLRGDDYVPEFQIGITKVPVLKLDHNS